MQKKVQEPTTEDKSREPVTLEDIVLYVCRHYNYKLYDIYEKRHRDGGLTKFQLIALYEDAQKEQADYYKYLANLQGFDIDNKQQETTTLKDGTELTLFKDPADYEHMNEEEKKAETERMMKGYRNLVKNIGAKNK